MSATDIATEEPWRDALAAGPNPVILAVDIAKRLRGALDWQKEIDPILREMGSALRGHRMILFKLMEVPGDRGLSQSIRAFWVDKRLEGIRAEPAIIPQSLVNDDDLLGRLAEEVRRGQSFVGHTRDLAGFLRAEFQRAVDKILLFRAGARAWAGVGNARRQ